MRLGVLFSGGKDSAFAAYLTEKNNHEIACLISIFSDNPSSYMFHTPSISKVEKQAERMEKPLIKETTSGEKEEELKDLRKVIKKAIKKSGIEGVVTGAVESAYQASRVQRICNDLDIECFNPIWQKKQVELLEKLLEESFDVIITGVSAFPLDDKWLGRPIDRRFIRDVKTLEKKYGINPAGEGGEFETFVLNCPLYNRPLEIVDREKRGKQHSWSMEIEVK
ncbi:MAG: diphthine--ammonia ligase [Candidatus Thermoplasmatota archaeon]